MGLHELRGPLREHMTAWLHHQVHSQRSKHPPPGQTQISAVLTPTCGAGLGTCTSKTAQMRLKLSGQGPHFENRRGTDGCQQSRVVAKLLIRAQGLHHRTSNIMAQQR